MRLRLGYNADATATICAVNESSPYCFDRVMHIRHQAGAANAAACANIANHMACAGPGTWPTNWAQDVTIAVTANETYYVLIDSYWDGGGSPGWVSGPYYLHIDL
jgi:hypothetical protein